MVVKTLPQRVSVLTTSTPLKKRDQVLIALARIKLWAASQTKPIRFRCCKIVNSNPSFLGSPSTVMVNSLPKVNAKRYSSIKSKNPSIWATKIAVAKVNRNKVTDLITKMGARKLMLMKMIRDKAAGMKEAETNKTQLIPIKRALLP